MLLILLIVFSLVSTNHCSEQSQIIKASDEHNNQLLVVIKDSNTFAVQVARYQSTHNWLILSKVCTLGACGLGYLYGKLSEDSVKFRWDAQAMRTREKAVLIKLISSWVAVFCGGSLLNSALEGPNHSRQVIINLPVENLQ